MTLTLKSSNAPLREQVDHLTKHARNFRYRPLLKRALRGGIYFLQVTYNESTEQWHPHLHILADMDYIDQRALSKLWLSVTLTSKIVDIRTIRDPRYAAGYVSRYVARPAQLAELPPQAVTEIVDALHGKRLAGTFGTGTKAKLLQREDLDPADWITVGTWYNVTQLAPHDQRAYQILKAWTTKTPLPEGITIYDPFNPIHPLDAFKETHPPPYKQGELDYDTPD